MSIATRTGDLGSTGLMYNRRVSKSHPRVEAYGVIDELNAAVGLARATTTDPWAKEQLLVVQKDLVTLMGELATPVEELDRYVKDGYPLVVPELTAKLDSMVKTLEECQISFKGWATPGATLASASLDVARTTCRRGERRVVGLQEANQLSNAEIIIYLNRFSDVLWLMARWVESQEDTSPDQLDS